MSAGEREKEENIWRGLIFGQRRRRKKEKEKEKKCFENETNIYGGKAKYMADTQTHRLYEGRARILN